MNERPNVLTREMRTCKTCGLSFMVVGWLAWRTEGYCSKTCRPWRDNETQSAGKEAARDSQPQAGTAQAGDFAPAMAGKATA
jgi:hypothetical protein